MVKISTSLQVTHVAAQLDWSPNHKVDTMFWAQTQRCSLLAGLRCFPDQLSGTRLPPLHQNHRGTPECRRVTLGEILAVGESSVNSRL